MRVRHESLRLASPISQQPKRLICGPSAVPGRKKSASGSQTSISPRHDCKEAEKALQRTQLLREGFTVTRVQIDQALRDARMDAALLDEVRAKLALLKAGSREEDITEARSRRDAAKAREEEAEARLGYCSVDAPTSRHRSEYQRQSWPIGEYDGAGHFADHGR
jgi:hypothetical protein